MLFSWSWVSSGGILPPQDRRRSALLLAAELRSDRSRNDMPSTPVTLLPVSAADVDGLASLRVMAMRESLELAGRFDADEEVGRCSRMSSPTLIDWARASGWPSKLGGTTTTYVRRNTWTDAAPTRSSGRRNHCKQLERSRT